MKITVKNLGAVKQAEIDLKPLTVFVGHNGTGKTWTAYALASIFSEYGYKEYLESYLNGKTSQTYPTLDKTIEQFIAEGSAKIDIVQFAKDNIQTYINDVASLAPSWMRSYLSTNRVSFENLKVTIDLQNDYIGLSENIKQIGGSGQLSIVSKQIKFLKEENAKTMYFFVESSKKSEEQVPASIVKRFIYKSVFAILHQIIFSNTPIFPTERTTAIEPIPNKIFHIDIGVLSDEQNVQFRKKLADSNLSWPVFKLSEIFINSASSSLDEREKQKSNDYRIGSYINLASFLEDKILSGKTNFEDSNIEKELLFSTEKIKLEIHVTSSMIKELVLLVLYLRYLAEPNDLIVIDEPEMNLHPAAQIEIIEFLAMLVNAGLNVMVTTHSPYIVDHISNLIEAKKQHNPEEIKDYFYLEDSRAFIEQDKVSVYLFEDGTAKNILSEDGSINWETFWNVSSDVSNIYAELLKNKKN